MKKLTTKLKNWENKLDSPSHLNDKNKKKQYRNYNQKD